MEAAVLHRAYSSCSSPRWHSWQRQILQSCFVPKWTKTTQTTRFFWMSRQRPWNCYKTYIETTDRIKRWTAWTTWYDKPFYNINHDCSFKGDVKWQLMLGFFIKFCRWHEQISLVQHRKSRKINLEPVFFKWFYISARMSMGLSGGKSIQDFLAPMITETGESVTSNVCARAIKPSNQNGVD